MRAVNAVFIISYYVFEGYHTRMNSRIYRNHPNIWSFIRFLQNEKKRSQYVTLQWAAGATRKKNVRTTMIQHRTGWLKSFESKNERVCIF